MTKKLTKKEQLVHSLVKKVYEEPKVVDNYYNLATLLTQEQDYEQAEELLQKAIPIFNDQSEKMDLINYGLGNIYYQNGLYDQALGYFKKITETKLQHDKNLMIAQSYYALKKYKLAFAFGLTALERHRQDFDTNQLMGDIELAMGDYDAAKTYYDVALGSSKTAKLLFNRGIIAMIQENGDLNNQFFNQSKELDEEYFEQSKQRLIDIDKLTNQSGI